MFGLVSDERQFDDQRRFQVILDGDRRDYGQPRYSREYREGQIAERMILPMEFVEFRSLAEADTVEARLGWKELDLSYADRGPLRMLADTLSAQGDE